MSQSSNQGLQVVAVTGGKGGVGKSNLSVNMAVALAKQNKRVLLFDADLGLANVDVLLGLHPEKNLHHVLGGECSLQDIVLTGPESIRIVPSASGITAMSELSAQEQGGIIAAFNELAEDTDVLIVDTAAGISPSVLGFCMAAQEVLVVVCNEPTSITDAYAIIKIMSQDHNIQKVNVVANMIQNQEEGENLFRKLQTVTDNFLDVRLNYLGGIPYEKQLAQSVRMQQPLLNAFPNCRGARAIERIAEAVSRFRGGNLSQGGMSFFMEKLIAQQQDDNMNQQQAAAG